MKTLNVTIILIFTVSITGNSVFAQNVTNSTNSIQPIPYSILRSASPTLTPSETQSLVKIALDIPELQNWSHDWHYIDMGFLGNNKLATGGFEWQYAIINLKSPSDSAPIPCDNDWWAWIEIDMTTMKVVRATYPTMESHQCQVATGGGPGTSGIIASVIDSPLKQFKLGISPDKIKCKTNFVLIFKGEDGTPACVKPDTAKILIERDWASSIIVTPPTVQQTSGNNTSPASFEPCDTPYSQSNNGIAVLYMPTNSIGKVCVNYSNGNDPATVTPRVFDAQNLSHDTQDISISPLQANVVHGNSTIVYTITSGNKAGFYGLTIFCYGTPIAVGYDNQSRIITGDFPWLHQTFYCPLQSYNYHIVGVGGEIGIKYIPP